MKHTLLVVDDDRNLRLALRVVLKGAGFQVIEAEDGQRALELLTAPHDIDLVITDLSMPRLDGMGLLEALARIPGAPPAIMITANGSERRAVEAVQLGAIDYFSKPFDESEILHVVHRNLRTAHTAAQLRQAMAGQGLARHMVFESNQMLRVAERVQRVSKRDIPVLITGESGTGKELVSRAIRAGSDRSAGPFLPINCAALQDDLAGSELFGHVRGAFTGAERSRQGFFRQASGGTLLLDEVGELSAKAQGALLRVLQEGVVRAVGSERFEAVDVRVIAATNRDLLRDPGFRDDLYYRLKVVEIHLPALRDRPDDIVPLARHFVNRAARQFGLGEIRLSGPLEQRLVSRPWPGNVRELKHLVESLVALTDEPVISLATWRFAVDTEAQPQPTRSLKGQVDAFERGVLQQMLTRCEGNQSETARRLGVSRLTLSSKLKKHGLR